MTVYEKVNAYVAKNECSISEALRKLKITPSVYYTDRKRQGFAKKSKTKKALKSQVIVPDNHDGKVILVMGSPEQIRSMLQ